MHDEAMYWDTYDYLIDMAIFATSDGLLRRIADFELVTESTLQGVVWC